MIKKGFAAAHIHIYIFNIAAAPSIQVEKSCQLAERRNLILQIRSNEMEVLLIEL